LGYFPLTEVKLIQTEWQGVLVSRQVVTNLPLVMENITFVTVLTEAYVLSANFS